MNTTYALPELSLVVLIGVSGSGKSTFARQHFGPFEVLSSDYFRGLVSNDENDQAASAAAFDALRYVAGKRLDAGLLTVVDATNVQPASRKSLIELAKAHDVLPVAIVLDVPESVCIARTAGRADRDFGASVIHRQHDQLRRSQRFLAKEGFRRVHRLDGEEQVAAASFIREPLLNNRKGETGPFDAIGDVHGCRSELESLLGKLGYRTVRDDAGRPIDAVHPQGRKVIFLGDLVDRGPDTPGVLRLVMGMVKAGHALAVPGNHEAKLIDALRGKKVTTGHGLAETLTQLSLETPEFRREVADFCYGLVSHLVLDGGRLVVAHAGLKESYHGRASGRVRAFSLYGETTGETDEYHLPVRYPWADDYRGSATVLYGHVPTPEVEWINNTLCLDTGCVFGGKLTALRYPEREVVSVPAERVWYQPVKPLHPPTPAVADRDGGLLRITDVLGKTSVETATHGRIGVREENAAGALEVMSRYALDPRWLAYLPPTMSPTASSGEHNLLEHPAEAFSYFAKEGVTAVICEEKHMGSRAVVVVCRSAAVAADRFGATDGTVGVVYTRTGRPFFAPHDAAAFLDRLSSAVTSANLWQDLATDWLILDAELLPWSLKAGELIREQYASVGAAALDTLPSVVAALESAGASGVDVGELLDRTRERSANAAAYVDSYRRYVGRSDGLDGVQLAPFQVLAAEGATFEGRDHAWHLTVADRLVAADSVLVRRTDRIVVELGDATSVSEGIEWWERMTRTGAEGMVVKPLANLVRTSRGLVQPGIKVRGAEYLRIIYGPDYTLPVNLVRLRDRNLGHKRSMALREYALGLEALTRFVDREPLWRVHQAVFAVLALESEPVDPRL